MAQSRRPGSIDYSRQLDDIGAPDPGRAGALIEQAGRTAGSAAAMEGQAKAMGIQADTQLATFLGTQAIEAVKGKLMSDEGKEIQATVDQFMNPPDVNATAATEAGIIDAVSGFMGIPNTPLRPEVAAMQADATRVLQAQQQGVLSRDEALTRIAATVKKYSAVMPGWASEFRRVAADITGINNIDTLPVRTALTEQSAREKAAEKQAAAQLQLDKEVASWAGVTLDQVPAYRALYYQSKQLEIAHRNEDNKIKLGNLKQEEVDKSFARMAMLDTATMVADVAKDLTTLGALHRDPKKFIESQEFGGKLHAKLSAIELELVERFRQYAKVKPGEPSWSAAEAQKVIDSLRTDMNNIREMVKTVEGRNMFLATIKKAENDVTLMLKNFELANPHAVTLRWAGVYPEIFKGFMTMPDAEFNKRFPNIRGAMEAVANPTGMESWANLHSSMLRGNAPSLSDVSKVNPKLAQLEFSELLESAKTWVEKPNPTPQDMANVAAVYKGIGANVKFEDVRMVNAIHGLFQRPAVSSYLSKLPETEREKAVGGTLVAIEQASSRYIKEFKELLDQYNNPEANVAARAGVRLSVEQDPFTLKLKVTTSRAARSAQLGGRSTTLALPSAAVTADAREAQRRLSDLVDRLNKMADIYHTAGSILSPEMVGSVADFRNRVAEVVKEGGGELSAKFLQKVQEAVGGVPQGGTGVPNVPSRAPTDAANMIVTPEEQAARDRSRLALLENELQKERAAGNKVGVEVIEKELAILRKQMGIK